MNLESSSSDSWSCGGVSEEHCSESGENWFISGLVEDEGSPGGRGSSLLDLVLVQVDGDKDVVGLVTGKACLVAHSST